jgi:hypothetical protein
MVETFKILNNIDQVQHEHILPISRTATRGHNQKIYNKNYRTNIRKYSFSQRIVDMWNSLPKQVIETKTVNTFKSQLNNHWKNLEIKFSPDVYRPEEQTQINSSAGKISHIDIFSSSKISIRMHRGSNFKFREYH